jgi:hypothetical protein
MHRAGSCCIICLVHFSVTFSIKRHKTMMIAAFYSVVFKIHKYVFSSPSLYRRFIHKYKDMRKLVTCDCCSFKIFNTLRTRFVMKFLFQIYVSPSHLAFIEQNIDNFTLKVLSAVWNLNSFRYLQDLSIENIKKYWHNRSTYTHEKERI